MKEQGTSDCVDSGFGEGIDRDGLMPVIGSKGGISKGTTDC